MEEGWLTAADAARWLGVSPGTVVRLMHDGAIPRNRVGRSYRISVADLDAYVDAHHVEPGSLSHLTRYGLRSDVSANS